MSPNWSTNYKQKINIPNLVRPSVWWEPKGRVGRVGWEEWDQWAPPRPAEQIINWSDFPTISLPAPQHNTAFCSSLFSLPSSALDLLVPRLSLSSQKLSFLRFVKNVVLTFATDWHASLLFICWEQWFSNEVSFLPQGTLGKVWRYFWWCHWGKGVGYHWHLVGQVTDALNILL